MLTRVSVNHLFWTVLNENQYTHSSNYVLLDFLCKNIHDDLGQHNNLDATKQWITLKLWGTHVESMFQYFILFLCCVLFFAELLHCVSDFVTYLANPFGVPDADLRLLCWTSMVIARRSVQTRRWNSNYMLFHNSVSFELLVLCSVSFKSRSWLSSSKSILLNILCGVHAARLSVKDAGYFWPAVKRHPPY